MAERIRLGQLLATPGALAALQEARVSAAEYLSRHAERDWGEVCQEDWAFNDRAAEEGGRLLSAYTLPTGMKIWIITEADRSSTTLLLPSEY